MHSIDINGKSFVAIPNSESLWKPTDFLEVDSKLIWQGLLTGTDMRLLRVFLISLNGNVHLFSVFHCRYANGSHYRMLPQIFRCYILVIGTPWPFWIPKTLGPHRLRIGAWGCICLDVYQALLQVLRILQWSKTKVFALVEFTFQLAKQ